jgi:prepilin-type processing-associated H-X9-DG protein
LLVVVGILGFLMAILVPAVQHSREAARGVACRNNLRQLGIGLHLFHDANGVFPASGWTRPGPGNPDGRYVGWRALVLPYLEQKNLHQLYDFKIDWWEGTNAVAAAVPIAVYRCPSVPASLAVSSAVAKPPRPEVTFANPIAGTDYEAIMGVKPDSLNGHFETPIYNSANRFSVMSRNSRSRFANVHDGTSTTIMVVECGGRPAVYHRRRLVQSASNDQGIGWADSEGPFSLDGATADGSLEGCGPTDGCDWAMNTRNDNEPYSFHAGGSYCLFVDGHVEFVAATVDLRQFASLCTMDAADGLQQ